jgi:hypothetical protein
VLRRSAIARSASRIRGSVVDLVLVDVAPAQLLEELRGGPTVRARRAGARRPAGAGERVVDQVLVEGPRSRPARC